MERSLEKNCLALLFISIVIIVLVISFYIFENYLDEPSLFIPPDDYRSHTTINMVLEAENLEGLRKICALWASREDLESNMVKLLGDALETKKRDALVFFLLLPSLYVLGLGQLYFKARQFRKASENAL